MIGEGDMTEFNPAPDSLIRAAGDAVFPGRGKNTPHKGNIGQPQNQSHQGAHEISEEGDGEAENGDDAGQINCSDDGIFQFIQALIARE